MKLNRLINKGFTLSELLIALAILGVIATFTIPKVLTVQRDQKWNSMAKEAAAAISEAYQMEKLTNGISASTSATDIANHLNYLQRDTLATNQTDRIPGDGPNPCNPYTCFRLANGSVIAASANLYHLDSEVCTLFFYFDPDGVYSGSPTGQGKAILFWLTYNGRIFSSGKPGTGFMRGVCNAAITPGTDPEWFSWD